MMLLFIPNVEVALYFSVSLSIIQTNIRENSSWRTVPQMHGEFGRERRYYFSLFVIKQHSYCKKTRVDKVVKSHKSSNTTVIFQAF